MLENEKIVEHIRQASKGCNASKEIIMKNNIPLLKCIIKKFLNKGIEYDDLYQIASMGLLKAINNFDESFNVKFSTYLVPMVIGEIKRFIRDNGAIKISRAIKILSCKITAFNEEFYSKNSIYPTIEEIACNFNVEKEDVVIAMNANKMPISIYDNGEDDEEGSKRELLNSLSTGEKEDDLIEKIEISSIIDKLPEREKKVIILRYFRDQTQGEVAKALGVSQVQVSRIENKILNKIRLII